MHQFCSSPPSTRFRNLWAGISPALAKAFPYVVLWPSAPSVGTSGQHGPSTTAAVTRSEVDVVGDAESQP